MVKDGQNSPPRHPTQKALNPHRCYLNFTENLKTNNKPTFEELKSYLRDAYKGLVPIPLNTENLSKSYAYFGGAQHKQTIQKILSKKELAFNLIPGLEQLTSHENFDLKCFKDYICQKEEDKDIAEIKRLIHFNNQKAINALEDTFQNPTLAMNALKAVSKKQWGQLLVKAPSNQHLLQATAKLSSEDFFKGGMHLAFLELEPEIYGALTAETAQQQKAGFKAKKYAQLLLELELALKALTTKQLNEEKYKADAKIYKKSDQSEALQESEVRPSSRIKQKQTTTLNVPEENPSFIQKVIRDELGYDIPINRLQVQRILEAADDILKEPHKTRTPIDFLHSKHPDIQQEKVTFNNMDLSKGSEFNEL